MKNLEERKEEERVKLRESIRKVDEVEKRKQSREQVKSKLLEIKKEKGIER